MEMERLLSVDIAYPKSYTFCVLTLETFVVTFILFWYWSRESIIQGIYPHFSFRCREPLASSDALKDLLRNAEKGHTIPKLKTTPTVPRGLFPIVSNLELITSF